MIMPKIDYPSVIEEDVQELEKLEKRHRHSHLFHRVRMLRLLKLGECANLSEAAEALGYGWRQCQRGFAAYHPGGKRELLVSRVDERGPKALVTEEALGELEEAMKRGEIATIAQAHQTGAQGHRLLSSRERRGVSPAPPCGAEDGAPPAREGRRTRARGL